ncbi:MAG TPA: hypothetical protein PL041_09145, partial [Melioribacteraceae bacterium]|nr:hypothetical protein [Melioribacteraceae bacterium]
MKKNLLFILIILFFGPDLYAQDKWGLKDEQRSYIGIKVDDNSANWYSLWNSGTGTYHGSTLATFTSNTQSLSIVGWDVKTWKNDGEDVTGATLYYVIYKQGQRPTTPTFTQVIGGWLVNLTGSDQKWGSGVEHIINISSLDNNSTYCLE